MATLHERLTALRQATAHLNTMVMQLEKVAADLLEDAAAAGDTETYRDAVLYQRAGHIAYDVLNLDPDLADIAMGAHSLTMDNDIFNQPAGRKELPSA